MIARRESLRTIEAVASWCVFRARSSRHRHEHSRRIVPLGDFVSKLCESVRGFGAEREVVVALSVAVLRPVGIASSEAHAETRRRGERKEDSNRKQNWFFAISAAPFLRGSQFVEEGFLVRVSLRPLDEITGVIIDAALRIHREL